MKAQGPEIAAVLRDSDACHAPEKTVGLIFTGPTGANANDAAAALVHF